MMENHKLTKRRVRSAVKVTRKALNRALDAAEPRLQTAAVELSHFGRGAYDAVQKGSRQGLEGLMGNYGRIERRVRRRVKGLPQLGAGRWALVAAGVAVLAVGLLRR